MNCLELSASVLERQMLRYTPAGLPALEMLLKHESEMMEAGYLRDVQMTIPAIALGDLALMLADTQLGTRLQVRGFLALKRKNSFSFKLHLQEIITEKNTA